MEREILKLEENYLELVEAILSTDLEPRIKVLKISSEAAKLQARIEQEILEYKIEMHLNELPF